MLPVEKSRAYTDGSTMQVDVDANQVIQTIMGNL